MYHRRIRDLYFRKKSPKADKAREKTGQEPEQTKEQKFMGTRDSPLLGEPNQVGSQEPPSRDPKPVSEECGRTWSLQVKKKALKALERWPPDIGPRPESPKRGRLKKRHQRSALGKKERVGSSEVM